MNLFENGKALIVLVYISKAEVAYYLGHVTKKGPSVIQTTARYTQVSREQVKEKLKRIKG